MAELTEPVQAAQCRKTIEQRNVSKRIVQPVLRYIDDTAGRDITEQVLAEMGLDRLYFDDIDGFMPLKITEQLFAAAVKHTGDAEFAYHMGRSLPKYMNRLQAVIGGVLLSPAFIYTNMGRIERGVVRTTQVDVKRLAHNRFRLSVSFSGGYREPPSACRNRHGTYEGIPVIFGLPCAVVKHPQCAFRGDPCCVYDVTVADQPNSWFLRIAVSMVGLAAIFGMITPVFWKGWGIFWGVAALNAGLLAYMAFQSRRTRDVLRWAGRARETVETHMVSLKQEYERTRFLYDLTVELNRYLDQTAIFDRVIAALRESFGYATCQVWLVSDRTLHCSRAAGLPVQAQNVLGEVAYSMEEGLRQSGSFVERVLGKRETLLINEPDRAVESFTKTTRDLIALLKPSALILVPLVEKGQAIGMLVATHSNGTKVTYVDRLLFEAAAPVVSNALERARLYGDLQRRIEERGVEIDRQQSTLMGAREMAIQSEKLSALGKMSAGIAHEINNPLNFLLNVAPDLRKDTNALTAILRLGQMALDGTEQGRVLAGIVELHQLDEHLREREYVFSTIDKSLDKAKRVVNSLRVFSRVSSITDAPTAGIARDIVDAALELIPQKYRTSVVINNTVDPRHRAYVGRNDSIQVFLSILQNALEAIAAGPQAPMGTVTISSASNGDWLDVSVHDSGAGIDPAVRERLFETFFTTKPRDYHTGLGLTVAAEIMKKYGGEIRCENTNAAGAMFTVRFKERGELN